MIYSLSDFAASAAILGLDLQVNSDHQEPITMNSHSIPKLLSGPASKTLLSNPANPPLPVPTTGIAQSGYNVIEENYSHRQSFYTGFLLKKIILFFVKFGSFYPYPGIMPGSLWP